jgi:FkbM family methyltransferase
MNVALKHATYGIAKTVARPFGLYPFPRTHRRHMVDVLEHFRIDCVLDVGAHYGEFGKLLRDLRFNGHILSFEPVSASFQRLKSAAQGDPKWRIFPFALGSADTESQIHLYRSSDFNSLLEPSGASRQFEGCTDQLGIETIVVRRLDSVYDTCTEGMVSPRVYLKMDTQGYDLEVFRGAAGVHEKILAMQSELPGVSSYANQPQLCEALTYYWQSGYRPTGFFPVNHQRDGISVHEWDCVLVSEKEASARINALSPKASGDH